MMEQKKTQHQVSRTLLTNNLCWRARSKWPSMWFSSVGSEIHVFALGEYIIGPKNHVNTNLEDSNINKYFRQVDVGTSFATPAVGAPICLILHASSKGNLQ